MTEILLVDDERTIRDSLSRLLREAGFAVRVAANGAAGVDAFRSRRPDLVLLDVMMPGMDGYAVCEAMRSADRETPIVFLSALDAEDDQIRGLAAAPPARTTMSRRRLRPRSSRRAYERRWNARTVFRRWTLPRR